MGDQPKKISFGFSKLAKKTAIVSTNLTINKKEDGASKVEFIDCLEGKSIKLKDPIEIEQGPLIIPLTRPKEDKSVSHQIKSENVNISSLKGEFYNQGTNGSNETLQEETGKCEKTKEIQNKSETLDEIAAREILEELNRKKSEEDKRDVFSVPLTSNAPTGEKESTLEDYDNIPVSEFGVAMLRGMGWAPGKGIGKNEKIVNPTLPTLRPKGMGLGADNVIKSVDNKSSNEDLKMVKGSFVRVLAGAEKGAYGEIEGFDDESGRLIVKLVLKNSSVSLNEFMVQLVSKNEFKNNSKVINVNKYEKYKEEESKKESNERKFQKAEKDHNKEPYSLGKTRNSPEKSDNRSKNLKKNHSSSYESEEENYKSVKTKPSTSRYSDSKRSSSRRSRSPSHSQSESKVSQYGSHKIQFKKHESNSKHHNKNLTKEDKHRRSYSSDSSGSSSSHEDAIRNKRDSSRKNSLVNDRSTRRQRSSSNSSNSSDDSEIYSRKKSSKHKKKKSSSRFRSRSRSRSPRRHKKKKSKKHRD